MFNINYYNYQTLISNMYHKIILLDYKVYNYNYRYGHNYSYYIYFYMYVSQIHNFNLVNVLFIKSLPVTQKEVCFN